MSKKALTPEQAQIKAMKKENSAKSWNSFLAVALAVVLTFGIFFVGKSVGEKKVQSIDGNVVFNENSNTPSNAYAEDNSVNNNTVTPPQADDGEKEEPKDQGESVPNKEPEPNKEVSDDPADWSKEEIAEFYKKAAIKSHPDATSSQTMTMPKMIVNDGDGALNFFIQMITPVINTVLKNNTMTYGGITGGFEKLEASDIANAKAYKEGKYTVIEMTMVEQTDGIYGDAQGGTVGHAINVLGNVATAVEQFPAFDIKFEEADIKVHYANPTVKVRINEDGVIENGTWSYTSEIYIRSLKINFIMVDKADAEIEYVIVSGGGF